MIAVVLAVLVLIGGTIAAVKLRKGFVAAVTVYILDYECREIFA